MRYTAKIIFFNRYSGVIRSKAVINFDDVREGYLEAMARAHEFIDNVSPLYNASNTSTVGSLVELVDNVTGEISSELQKDVDSHDCDR